MLRRVAQQSLWGPLRQGFQGSVESFQNTASSQAIYPIASAFRGLKSWDEMQKLSWPVLFLHSRELSSSTVVSGTAAKQSSIREERESEYVQKEFGMPVAPWTPTRLLRKRKTLPKRMGYMMTLLEKEKEAEAASARSFPPFKAGDMIELKIAVPQNKGRETVFKGICIAKRNRGWRTSFTLRNFIGNNGGIERTFPLYSPHIKDLKVLEARGRKKYRRSKLYYLRDLQPKVYRIS